MTYNVFGGTLNLALCTLNISVTVAFIRELNEITIRTFTVPHVCCCTKMQKFTMYPVVGTAVDLCLCLFSPVKHYSSNQSSSNV